jgi:DNA-binding HxlR family transcriptional regulator
MNSTNSSANPCPIARALDVLGDAWSMLILRDAAVGLTRFDEFRKSLGIAPTMLTKRLAALTEEQLLEKRLYSERPPREEHEDRPAALRGRGSARQSAGRHLRSQDQSGGCNRTSRWFPLRVLPFSE